MHGKFDGTAELRADNKTLHVHGPIGFEDDERGAVLHITVTQDGSRVIGKSGFVRSNAVAWSATITGADIFHAGVAHGVMVAIVDLNDGNTEPYPYPGGTPCEADIKLRSV